jgi:hypothetical protein
MIQEHLSLKRLQKIYSKIRNFESVSGQKGFATRQLLWDFGIGKGQQSVAFQE